MSPEVDARAARLLGIRPPRGAAGSLQDLVDAVQSRLTFADLERFRRELAQTRAQFSSLMNVSERTLARYADDATRHVDAAIAERALRLARIQALAEYVLEDATAGRQWLATPQPGLRGRAPNDLIGSEFGAREVETLLNRIEHGVYT
jgi:putative toxin-antitoxin system antitoxin component (TIGR02293 family)